MRPFSEIVNFAPLLLRGHCKPVQTKNYSFYHCCNTIHPWNYSHCYYNFSGIIVEVYSTQRVFTRELSWSINSNLVQPSRIILSFSSPESPKNCLSIHIYRKLICVQIQKLCYSLYSWYILKLLDYGWSIYFILYTFLFYLLHR